MPPEPAMAVRSREIREAAQRLGFDLVGFTPAVTPEGFSHLVRWIERGCHGEMSYIPRRLDAYADPHKVLEGARSVIALAMNYHVRAEDSRPKGTRCDGVFKEPDPQDLAIPVQVARYARGPRDYHDLIRERLRELITQIHVIAPGSRARGVVDTAPVLERDVARSAGLGWFGKNTMLINKRLGSWFFLAAVLVDVELDYDRPHEVSHCGTCTACLDACPTAAFPEPHVLDARRCISYLTIELRGPVDPALRTGLGDWVFGCDICQEVCPWNRKAPVTRDSNFIPQSELTSLDARAIISLDPREFDRRFGTTPLARPGHRGLRRSAVLVIGNSRDRRQVPFLATLVRDPDTEVRGAVAWALGELGGADAAETLRAWGHQEAEIAVQSEIAAALQRLETIVSLADEPPPGLESGLGLLESGPGFPDNHCGSE